MQVWVAITAKAKLMLLAEKPQGFHAGLLVWVDVGKVQKCQLFHIHSSMIPLCKIVSKYQIDTFMLRRGIVGSRSQYIIYIWIGANWEYNNLEYE